MTTGASIDRSGSGRVTSRATGDRRRWRRAIAVVAVLVLIGVALIGAWSTSWLFEPNRYAAVRSIESQASYRDPALMAAVWRLPVATRYRRVAYEYQENQSFCGPASIANCSTLSAWRDRRMRSSPVRVTSHGSACCSAG